MAPLSIAGSTAVCATGVSSSSILGQKLPTSFPASFSVRAPARVGVATAKYGEKSVYFDLEDIGNTTGAWDFYGTDAPSSYNGLQSKFFEVFAGVFTKRGILLKLLLLGGGGAIAYAGSSASPDLLPMKKGPVGPPKKGPLGKL